MAAAQGNALALAGLGTAQPSMHYYRDYFSDPANDVFRGATPPYWIYMEYLLPIKTYPRPLRCRSVP
jgi:hypothetical protein